MRIFTWSATNPRSEADLKVWRAVCNLHPDEDSWHHVRSQNRDAYAGQYPDGEQWSLFLNGADVLHSINADRILAEVNSLPLSEDEINGLFNLFRAITKTVEWARTNQRDTKVGRARFVGRD